MIPKKVLLREEGPREGFQFHKQVIPTAAKLRLIQALCQTGISSIEATSFVRPDRVPQHGDAEDVAQGLPETHVRFRALYLNEKGFRRAIDCPKLQIEGAIMLAASEDFLKKNNNRTLQEVYEGIPRWLELFDEAGLDFERLMVSTAFGDQELTPAKSVVNICREAIEHAGKLPQEITFADTTGFGDPRAVRELVVAARTEWPNIAIGLHLHDTRGTGMANVYAGLLEGVERFDCSVAGLGGCPFTAGAAGNVPTEDVAFLCERLGIETGLDLTKYIECARLAEQIVGKSLPGKLKQTG